MDGDAALRLRQPWPRPGGLAGALDEGAAGYDLPEKRPVRGGSSPCHTFALVLLIVLTGGLVAGLFPFMMYSWSNASRMQAMTERGYVLLERVMDEMNATVETVEKMRVSGDAAASFNVSRLQELAHKADEAMSLLVGPEATELVATLKQTLADVAPAASVAAEEAAKALVTFNRYISAFSLATAAAAPGAVPT